MSKKVLEQDESTQLEVVVRDLTSRMPEFPKTTPGRQLFILASASNLHVINNLFQVFRSRFKTVNEGDALAIAAKYFMENVKDRHDEEA